ncbi:fumarylacetoacetate hydrolase family protein [Streptomyces stelliscabiei]|nr:MULTISPECIES: fumarylacetoacetate hydrolase family protein [Streptomyces]MDX2518913.1 fumarylacetoacetate hydrolase family protein [Streptomyces stelliscabiei]MDX2556455.1 fumarylacetoacetate hydrolase family protein [Streptomyces stelliscabiei]MDX2615135.1 fumarylacetoacetate hydrolase family protein [Streptomyces stelliscabiei]MDX2640260.1 fumarylacetoacetate hydrolase family protein [Streptomyces stelliscabiei]MDX2665819.1 fumarylacetoacetate hydrolase family protein [Streptomyces stelli
MSVKPPATSAPLFTGPFALGTFSTPGRTPSAGLVLPDGRVLDLRTTVLALLERWDEELPRLHGLAGDPTGDWLSLDDLNVHAPVEPRQIFQSGANYRQHVIDLEVAHRAPDDPRTVEEARAEIAAIMDKRAAEDLPYVFIGLPTTITGPYDDVVLPSWARKPDWELELAAVISRPTHRVTVEEAWEHVAGYTIANDLTDRSTVFRRDMPAIGTDWLRCKNAPGFTPLGPWIVPAGSIADPSDLRVTLKLNGETMQDESTKDMIFGVARMVSYISETAQLLPGDLVLTGSPAGNGMHWGRLLRDGDVMDGSVTGLGAQRTRCVTREAP